MLESLLFFYSDQCGRYEHDSMVHEIARQICSSVQHCKPIDEGNHAAFTRGDEAGSLPTATQPTDVASTSGEQTAAQSTDTIRQVAAQSTTSQAPVYVAYA